MIAFVLCWLLFARVWSATPALECELSDDAEACAATGRPTVQANSMLQANIKVIGVQADSCAGGWQQGDGIGGTETYIGYASSAANCIQLVKEQAPSANGATYGDENCYAEFGMNGAAAFPSYTTCQFPTVAPSPPPTPLVVITRVQQTAFNGGALEPVREMTVSEAKSYLLANTDKYAGFGVVHHLPGKVWFARVGAATFSGSSGVDVYTHDASSNQALILDDSLFKVALPELATRRTMWRRPGRGQAFMDDVKVVLFADITPQDVLEGGLGTCWLNAGMAAVATTPSAIKSLFVQQAISETGRYDIWLFVDGAWQTVTIDDRLPVVAAGNSYRPAYTRPSGQHAIWPMLLGKAYAVISGKGGYKKMNGGYTNVAVERLSGTPAADLERDSYDSSGWWNVGGSWKNPNAASAIFAQYSAAGYPMTTGTGMLGQPAFADWAGLTENGLCPNHAYTVVQWRHEVGSIKVNLVQLRNPWGHDEWLGAWSDNSALWAQNPDVRASIQPTFSEDGLFWISMTDFASNFGADGVTVAKTSN